MKILAAILALLGLALPAQAQTSANFVDGQVIHAQAWNTLFASKADATGGVLTGPTIAGGTAAFGYPETQIPVQSADAGVNLSPWEPLGYPGALFVRANNTGILGLADNTAGGSQFPVGVAGYGSLEASAVGGAAFGLFGRVDVHAAGSGGANELDCYNFAGAPSTALPPEQGFGSTQVNCVGLQIVAYGTYSGSVAEVLNAGSQPWDTGLYVEAGGITRYAIMVDATSTAGPQYDAVLKGTPTTTNLQIQTQGAMVASNTVFSVQDQSAVTHMSVRQNGDIYANNITLSGAVTIGSSTGVSCAAGSVSLTTLTITNGIVTHC